MEKRLALLLFLPIVLGCGTPAGKVSGRVLYHGKPLPGGFLTFQSAMPRSSPIVVAIDDQGHYEAALPLGEVRVAVDNRELKPEEEQSPGQVKPKAALPPPAGNPLAVKPPGRYIPIPSKYFSTETSGLSFMVEPGEHPHDLKLEASSGR